MIGYTFYNADIRVRRYAEALVQRGGSADAIALARDDQPHTGSLRGVRILRVQKRVIDETGPLSYLFKLARFFFSSAWVITREHLREPYDLIHVHSVPDFEVFATIIPRLLGAKVILDIHDLVPEFYASKFGVSMKSPVIRLLILLERLSIAYSNHVIISNDLWRERLIERSVRPEKCTTILNYPDTTIFSPSKSEERKDRGFVLCYPGSLNWHQGLDLAIEAVNLLRDRIPAIKLLIVGDGPERGRLENLIQRLRLEEFVSLARIVPSEEVAKIMASVDLGVVPKRANAFGNEAFSTKIFEFMAVGVPVVVPRTKIDQLYFSDELVEFFEPDRAEDLAAKIEALWQNRTRRDQLRAAGAQWAAANSWDSKKHVYLELVDKMTGAD
jgi:glycosyltransferase involved in cell wall biosynthesis